MLVAADFRAEHRSALDWLNTRSESASFFGLALQAFRIDDSDAAPHFEVVVSPDSWVRETREAHGGRLSQRSALYREFWGLFLERFSVAHAAWIGQRKPSKETWMSFPAGRTGLYYAARLGWVGREPVFQVYLCVDGRDVAEADARFGRLEESRGEIETAVGYDMVWTRSPDTRARFIACHFEEPVRVEDRDRWHELVSWGIDRLGRLRDALQPMVEALP